MASELEHNRGGIMTTHILIQCSKKKNLDVDSNLTWSEKTTLESWKSNWANSKTRIKAKKLYAGRAIKREFGFLSSNIDVSGYIISAGAGLVRLEEMIPSYESTFSSNIRPEYSEWHNLPLGGLSNLEVEKGDRIVSFAAPNYHRALRADPEFQRLALQFTVANTSPLSKDENVTSIQIHSRTAEYLGVAYIDLNSELLNQYLNGGIKRLEEVYQECENLPSLKQRRKITDEDLLALVESFESISSITNSVKYIRHTLGISASYERIRDAIHQLR